MLDATVIIAAWCAEESLATAIDSALAQKDVRIEVIVVDDSSPDETLALARTFAQKDARVRVLHLEKNGGPSAARNAGIAAAKGRWVAVLDSDDAMLPNRLAQMIRLAEERCADIVFDDFQPVDGAATPTRPSHLSPYEIESPAHWDLEFFLAGCQAEPGRPSLGYLKPLMRLEFLRKNDLWYNESLRNGEDFHLIAEMLAAGGSLWVTPMAGYLYTERAGSISNRLNPDHASALADADAAFFAAHQETMSSKAAGLMQRRMQRLGDFNTTEIVLQAVRAGHLGKATAALCRRPRASGRLFQQTLAAVRRRLS